ncbi:MAG TPA: DNA repair protein RadC [Candidatus Paceibacterota bacterium]|nr:DNA repair protein RadC [Candidatus Paceibacterota bacterium]
MTTAIPSPYRIASRPLMLDNEERRYTLTIHDLPNDDRPRERLLAEGASALSSQELIAVLLSTGTTKENVLSMAHRIIREYGEKNVMQETDPARLAREIGLPIGKAMQVVAAGELGRRFFERNPISSPTLRTASEVFAHVADMRTLAKEHLRGLYLNAHYKVVRDEIISIGTVDANMVHPREVFRPALEYAAAAVILVHNHPSGTVDASAADMAVTEQIIEAGAMLGIPLVDHVVVTKDAYASVPAGYRIP